MYEYKTFGTNALAPERRETQYGVAKIIDFPMNGNHVNRAQLTSKTPILRALISAFQNFEMVKCLKTGSCSGQQIEGISLRESIIAISGITAFGIALLYLFV